MGGYPNGSGPPSDPSSPPNKPTQPPEPAFIAGNPFPPGGRGNPTQPIPAAALETAVGADPTYCPRCGCQAPGYCNARANRVDHIVVVCSGIGLTIIALAVLFGR